MNGFTDLPTKHITDDQFDVSRYVNGLSNFILDCYTPMTIAVQGDWGSGKTSLMNMVRESLGNRVIPVWFNTWQYSQFSLSDELSLSLMSNLVESLSLNDSNSHNLMNSLHKIGKVARKVSLIAADTFVGGRFADVCEQISNSLTGPSDNRNLARVVNTIKDQFQACINTAIEKENAGSNRNRVVIFIDDLDRLQPAKAVEILEILKLFLDCEHCVFVLAIDYEVVSQGVKQKYGATIGEEKGKSFFDKIIQVPFKMPIAQYNVRKFVEEQLKKLNFNKIEEESQIYVNVIQSSIGCNPRSMKRLFNALLLLIKVAPDQMLANDWNKKVLFAVLCLQLSFEKVYNYIVLNRPSINEEFLVALSDRAKFDEYQDSEQLRKELSVEKESDLNFLNHFMKNFNQIVDQNSDGNFSDQEIKSFIDVIGFSTITSSTDSKDVSNLDEVWNHRRRNRQLVKSVNEKLLNTYNLDFAVYQSNGDRGDWKMQYASGYKWFWKDGLPFCLDYIIKSELNNDQMNVQIVISPRREMTSTQFFNLLSSWSGESANEFNRTSNSFHKSHAFSNASADDKNVIIFDFVSPVVRSLQGFYD